ncbi:MAG: phosphatidate cytidylyltransferase [bacterium]|nr:phosphatidate cytidylyltransferase [bacterium]
MSNLTLRLLSAGVGVPVLLYCSAVGGPWLTVLIAGLQMLLLREWSVFATALGVDLRPALLVLAVAAVDVFVLSSHGALQIGIALLGVYLWIASTVFSTQRMPLLQIGLGALFLVYVALPLALWFPLHEHSSSALHGKWGALTLLLVATWLCDSAAYFAGRAMGRHKLYPEASPNKTVEGAIGGVLASGFVLPAVKLLGMADPAPLDYLVLPIAVGVAGQIGDLIESLMKREAKVKDTSQLIPGHGGFLDRFDSLLLSTPLYLSYLYLTRP